MANTENIEAKLCAYVDGELDPAGRAEIEAHLESNPQHRQLMAQLMQQRDLISGLPRERAPEDLFEAMTNQLERSVLLDGDAAQGGGGGGAGGSPHIAGRINPWPQRFAAAAVLLLAVGLAAVIYFVLPNQSQPDYARVGKSTGSSTPIAQSETTRRLDDLAAATNPTALARGDADRLHFKAGAMKAETIAPSDLPTGGAGTQPTALAVAPTPSLPSAPPAAAAVAPPRDVFSKNGGDQSKSSDLATASTMTNVFADAQINEKLKDAPGVPDNSMLVVVNAGNPSATNQQIREYFDNNGIKWEPASEPMPEPLELRQNQAVLRSRLGNTQMKLKGGGNVGDAAEGQANGGFGGGSSFGGQSAAAPPPAPTAPQRDEEKKLEVATAQQDLAKRDRTLDAAGEVDKSFAERSKVGEAAASAPPPPSAAKDGAPSAGADAVATNAQKQMRGGSRASGATSDLSATGGASGSTGTNAGTIAGAGAASAAPQANGKLAGSAGGATSGKQDGWRETADNDTKQQQQTAEEVAQVPSPAPAQPQAKPSESFIRSQSSAAAPSAEMEQQRQQGQQVQQQVAGQQSQQLQQQSQLQYGQSPQAHQVFIARGLTRQQVVSMNNAIANGNRINNYNRAGATITPTTLPSLDAGPVANLPMAMAKEQARNWDGYANMPAGAAAPGSINGVTGSFSGATGAGGAGGAGGGGAAPSTQPATAPASPATALADQLNKSAAATPTTAPTAVAARRAITGPAATQPSPDSVAAAAADERVDVVILVQPENEAAIQQLNPPAAPNAAATDAPPTPATTTATTTPATATAPATSKP